MPKKGLSAYMFFMMELCKDKRTGTFAELSKDTGA